MLAAATAAAMLPIAPAAASTAAGLEGCDIFICGGNHNESAAVDRPGTAEPATARAARAVAALAVVAAVALPVAVPMTAASAVETCPEWECGSNHNEGAARDGIGPG